jgi:hypothetical protein
VKILRKIAAKCGMSNPHFSQKNRKGCRFVA